MRGKRAHKRQIQKDVKYGSVLVGRLINKVMQDGKKKLAQTLVYAALEEGAKQVKMQPDQFLETAVAKVKPALEIRSRRVGGANYQVPVPVSPVRQDALAIRWIVDFTRSASGQSFDKLLMKELLDAYNGEGNAIRKKFDVEKMAEANKAFAHFRW
ncbi:30S ribosomal protein S7 [bacterium]|nr:30S ribosomal protein S7 [bacterium]